MADNRVCNLFCKCTIWQIVFRTHATSLGQEILHRVLLLSRYGKSSARSRPRMIGEPTTQQKGRAKGPHSSVYSSLSQRSDVR